MPTPSNPESTPTPLQLAEQGCFFVDVPATPESPSGHMYVEFMVPHRRTRELPVVMIHGGAQTGACFKSTPDGRPGWQELLVRQGYAVYVVDLPGYGRAANQSLSSEAIYHTRETIMERYTQAPGGPAPRAHDHRQWPGTGTIGDEAFEQFYLSQFGSLVVKGSTTALEVRCCAALIDRIGECIVVAHSLGATVAWPLAQYKAGKVKAVVAVEPNGPPFVDLPPIGDGARIARPWGISYIPLDFDPPIASPEALRLAFDASRVPSKSHRLIGLKEIPVCIVTGAASYHRTYDDKTVSFLNDAGVAVTHLDLAAAGILGNGHMMMLEMNNSVICDAIVDWLSVAVKSAPEIRDS